MDLSSVVSVEKMLLGDIAFNPSLLDDISLSGDEFTPRNKLIYRAMFSVYGSTGSIDVKSVLTELVKSGDIKSAGGEEYVKKIIENASVSSGYQLRVDIVKKQYRVRLYSEYAKKILEMADGDNDPDSIAGAAINMFLGDVDNRSGLVSIDKAVDERLDIIEKRHRGEFVYMTTGIKTLDDRVGGGIIGGQYILVGGRPGHGKTLFATIMAVKNAAAGIPVLIVTKEVPAHTAVVDILAHETHGTVSPKRIKFGVPNEDEYPNLMKAASGVVSLPIWYDEVSDTIEEIQLQIARMAAMTRKKDSNAPFLVIIDYLQLIGVSDPGIRRQGKRLEIEHISVSIKKLSMKYNIPIVLITSLSGDIEKRHDKRPKLSDAKETRQIDHDADLAFFMYRDQIYNPGEDPYGLGTNENFVEIICRKSRPTGQYPFTVLCLLSSKTHEFIPVNKEFSV